MFELPEVGASLTLEDTDVITFDLTSLGGASLLKIAADFSISSLGRDHQIVLTLSGDSKPGRYKSHCLRAGEGTSSTTSTSEILLGYVGWQLDAEMAIEFTLSLLPGRQRNCYCIGATAHDSNLHQQYTLQSSGAYLDKTAPITQMTLALQNGGHITRAQFVLIYLV